jgi:preprotein translocase subunit YajC
MTFNAFIILAQATPAPAVRPPDQGMNMMVWMIFAFVLIYFLTIRPQSKKQKQLQEQIASLKTGDKVVTNGGIHGLVANIQDGPTLTLKIADNVKIEVEKSAVTTILRPATETKAA